MSDLPRIVDREWLPCVLCGRELPKGKTACPPCNEDSVSTSLYRQSRDIGGILRRARGLILLGTLFLPQLFGPMAVVQTLKARALYRSEGLAEPVLEGWIKRDFLSAVIFTGIFVAVLLAGVLSLWPS